MNDISSATVTDNNSNCYVPKQLSSNLGSFANVDAMVFRFEAVKQAAVEKHDPWYSEAHKRTGCMMWKAEVLLLCSHS